MQSQTSRSPLPTLLATLFAVFAFALFPAHAQTVAEAASDSSSDYSLFSIITKGGWSIFPLVLLSFFTVGFIVYCFLSIRSGTVVTDSFSSAIDAYLKKKDYLGLLAQSSHEPEALARVVQSTLAFVTKNPTYRYELAREIAETEGSRQASRLYQRVGYLFDIGVIAPMLGLAGTVTGMIQSFHVIGVDPSTIRPAMLANGVAEALIATAGGLVVGIPAMIFYSYFKGRVTGLVAEMEAAATDFLAQLESQQTR